MEERRRREEGDERKSREKETRGRRGGDGRKERRRGESRNERDETRTAIVLGWTTRATRVLARSGFTYDARQHGRSEEVAQMLFGAG